MSVTTGSPSSTARGLATWIGQHTFEVSGPESMSHSHSIGAPLAFWAVDSAAENSSISVTPGCCASSPTFACAIQASS